MFIFQVELQPEKLIHQCRPALLAKRNQSVAIIDVVRLHLKGLVIFILQKFQGSRHVGR